MAKPLNENGNAAINDNVGENAGNEANAPLAIGDKYLYVNSNEAGGGFYQDGNEIYYANPYDSRRLYKYDVSANTAVMLVDDVIKVVYIRIYDDRMYFTGVSTTSGYGENFDAYRYAIFRANKDDSELEQIIDYAMNAIFIDNYLYYIDRPNEYDYSICGYNLQTNEKEVIIDNQQRPYQMNIVNDKVYYCKLDNTVMEYCISTKEYKELAYEESGLERLQYFKGALYYHSCFEAGENAAKTLVHKIDLATYENSVLFDFLELYDRPEDMELEGLIISSLNTTDGKVFFGGTLRMADRKDNEFGAFVYDIVNNSLIRIGYNSDRNLMAILLFFSLSFIQTVLLCSWVQSQHILPDF